MLPRHVLRWIFVPLLLCVAACGTEPERKPTPDPAVPQNTTPEGTIKRLVWAYENKNFTEYGKLFTGDFRFEFSTASDPMASQEYIGGWLKSDETASATHLSQGFSDPIKGLVPAASTIALTFARTIPTGDFDHADTTKYKVLATRVDGVFVVPYTEPYPEEVHYVIDNNFHRFSLVRGDAAVALAADQPADSTHWYVYGWIDETAQPLAPASIESGMKSTSWGFVKYLYR